MLKPMLASALFAGLIAGLFAAGLQLAFTVPLITQAELYETGTLTHFGNSSETFGHSHSSSADNAQYHVHEPSESTLSRHLLTVLTTVLAACGFGLLLVAAIGLAERYRSIRVDLRTGLLFGLAGFAASHLVPSLGLAPELPGMAAADLAARQGWWLGSVVATTAGLAMIVWGSTTIRLVGGVLIALPHIWGAPHPHDFVGVIPPEIAALHAARVIAIWGLTWTVLGALAGYFWSRETHTA